MTSLRGLAVLVTGAVLASGESGDVSCDADGVFKSKLEEGTGRLAQRVFYQRPILRIPQTLLLAADENLQRKLRDFWARRMELPPGPALAFGHSDGEAEEILFLSLALLEERRRDPLHAFFLATEHEEPPLALKLTDRQMSILVGTTVEALPQQAKDLQDALVSLGEDPMEAAWALGVVLRRAQHVLSPEDGGRRLRLAKVPQLLVLSPHPDAFQAPPFIEARVNVSGQERHALLLAADRDYQAQEEIFLWSGRLSDSELILRGVSRNESFKNPTGYGGKVTIPDNWNSNPRTPNYKEFRKFNCTSQEAFEVRLSKKGWPMRSFVRCFRVAWLLLNGWYTPQVIDQTSLLDKWPPPKKYSHHDWLGWTQADQATNNQIQDYCKTLRQRLRESTKSGSCRGVGRLPQGFSLLQRSCGPAALAAAQRGEQSL